MSSSGSCAFMPALDAAVGAPDRDPMLAGLVDAGMAQIFAREVPTLGPPVVPHRLQKKGYPYSNLWRTQHGPWGKIHSP